MTYVTQDMLADALANDIPDATETLKGIAKIATNAIVDDINNTPNDTDIMTPDKTKRMIDNIQNNNIVYRSSNYTAVSGDLILADTSSARSR